tara:strand:- start:434 stop:1138 length:705 start_codon:yes stop_codon:yes gene_type:complete
MQPIKENNNMKNLKTLNEFVVNESNINEAEAKEKPKSKPLPPPQYIDGEDMEPKMAKVLLNLAKKEYNGEWQGSYTVASGNKRMRFDAIQAITTLLKKPDSGNGNYGPPYGINVVMDKTGTIEDFENNKVGKLNTKSLSGAISSLSSAMKAAEQAHDKLGSLGWDAEDEKSESVESIINEEYIELMPEIANALGTIQSDWERWKNGSMTEPSDIKPAQRELKGWLDRWFKQNIK